MIVVSFRTRFTMSAFIVLLWVSLLAGVATAQRGNPPQSNSDTGTVDCGSAQVSVTDTLTLSATFVPLRGSITGTYTSNLPCGAASDKNGTFVDIFENESIHFPDGWGTFIITDIAGTNSYDLDNMGNNSAPCHGTQGVNGGPGNFNCNFTYIPPDGQNGEPATFGLPPFTITIGNGAALNFQVVPIPQTADLGPCESCEATAGSPINLTTGNVWIQRQDYALPGLGGGIQLTRTWNSLWPNYLPFEESGMFGDSWQSNLEQHIAVTNNGAQYWRGDGSAWQFSASGSSYFMTAPLDQHAALAFNTATQQFTVTLLNGSKRVFNNNGNLIAWLDPNGNHATVAYDSSNRIVSVTDAAGRQITFTYGNSSFPNLATSVQDSVGTIATYAYDAGGHLTSVTYADGSVVNYNSDANGLITSTTDSQGKVFESHTYDSTGRGLTSARANGVDFVTVSYSSGGVANLTDSLNNATQYGSASFGGRSFPTSVSGSGCDTCGGRGNQSFTYDPNGNRITATDPLGHQAKYAYDSNSDIIQESLPLDSSGTNYQTWNYTYNNLGEPLTATDPLGHQTTYTYDNNGNFLTVTTPSPGGKVGGSTAAFKYDAKGELTSITDPDKNITTVAYNSVGLVSSITDALKNATQFQYDARGNRTAVTDAKGQQTTYTYDVMNRLTKITYPTNPVTSTTIAYDYRGRKQSVTDQNGKLTQYAYDDADRLTTTTDANNGVTAYAYDTENNLSTITDAAKNPTSFAYDNMGRVTQVTFPSSFLESYSYDANGNMLSKKDRNGNTISYAYDFLNRLTQKTYPDSTTVNYTYDLADRLTQVSDASGQYGLSYDNMDRLAQASTAYSAIAGKTFTVAYGYDAASNPTSMTDPQSGQTSYVYDADNDVTSIKDPSRNAFTLVYDALSRRTQLTRPNGLATNYQYDTVSRLSSILHQITTRTGTTTLDGAIYQYDGAGNRISRADQRTQTTLSYAYDPIYELTTVSQGTTTTESYSYDAVGNRLSSLAMASYTYNNSNELTADTSATYTYDNNGNMLSKTDSTGTTSFAWDFENRLKSVTLPGGGGAVTFIYDPFGRRIQKASSTATTDYVYDGSDLLEEVNSSGTVLARYTQGPGIDAPLAESRSGTTSFYEADGLGSVTSLSNSSGALVNTYNYDSFGNLSGSSGTVVNPFRYTGREYDSETGIYYYRARYYDSNIGRFISEDPTRFFGAGNFYPYADNNPSVFTDPSGLRTVVIVFWDNPDHTGFLGEHSALYIDNNGHPMLYDPSGDTRINGFHPSNDIFADEDADLSQYIHGHGQQTDGTYPEEFDFNTTAAQEAAIAANINRIGSPGFARCADAVSTALAGIGPFQHLNHTRRPANLAKQLREIQSQIAIQQFLLSLLQLAIQNRSHIF